jgi:galactonate dehydratase
MKIKKVEIFDVEFGWDFATNWNPVIIKIITDEGIYGAGEVALAYGNGAKAGIAMVKELAESYLIGEDPFRIEYIWDRLFRKTFWGQGGGPVVYGAMSAIDEALWDIKGKALGVPVYELMGGKMWDDIRVYANGWYDSGLIEPSEYAEAACKVVEDGYNAMKFDPFGTDPEGVWDYPRRHVSDEKADLAVERVRAVREAVGSDVDILIEIHGNLGTTDAIKLGRRFEEFAPFFYEEPVDPLNVDSMKKVSEHVDIPIATGERLYTRYHFRQFIEKQALDILQPDIGLTGGLSEIKKIASYAETYNLHVQPHNCGGPVSTAAAVQFDACTSNFIIQEWFPYWRDDRLNIVKDAFELQTKNSYFKIPSTLGLGIELNDEYLDKFEKIEVE